MDPPQICIVLVDSTLNKNMVVWEKILNMPIDHYNVYKRDPVNGYQVIGGGSV